MVVKEAINSQKEGVILLANTFLVNYFAVEGLKYFSKEKISHTGAALVIY